MNSRIHFCLSLLVVTMAITTTTSLSRAFTLSVRGSGVASVNTDYSWAPSTLIPKGFTLVCNQNNWNVESTWKRLNGERDWLKATTNEAYVYFNSADRHWWIDEPGGLGVFVVLLEIVDCREPMGCVTALIVSICDILSVRNSLFCALCQG